VTVLSRPESVAVLVGWNSKARVAEESLSRSRESLFGLEQTNERVD
jgi:hypothetical protein